MKDSNNEKIGICIVTSKKIESIKKFYDEKLGFELSEMKKEAMKERNTKYWIITASKDHVKEGVENGFAQACHGKSSPLKRLQRGDFVIYYSGKQFFDKPEKSQEFTAIGKVKDDDIYRFQMNEDFCPSRRNVDFFDSKDISIRPLIDNLDFIRNKKSWGYSFRFGLLEINEHDYKLISSKML